MTVISERVKVLNILLGENCSIKKILEKVDLPEDSARKHIDALTNLGLIEKHQDGIYCIVEESKGRITHLVEQYQ